MLSQNCSKKATEAAAVEAAAEAASLADDHDAASHRVACFAAQHCRAIAT
jgi:hypothetical protein